jgi:hypothetical protein
VSPDDLIGCMKMKNLEEKGAANRKQGGPLGLLASVSAHNSGIYCPSCLKGCGINILNSTLKTQKKNIKIIRGLFT